MTAQLTHSFQYPMQLPPLTLFTPAGLNIDGKTHEPTAKRPRYDCEWSNSSGSSPCQSESEQVNIVTSTASTSTTTTNQIEDAVPSQSSDAESRPPLEAAPAAPPVAVSPTTSASAIVAVQQTSPASPDKTLRIQTSSTPIVHDAKFHSFAEFESAFELWKRQHFHPFRVASSETLKEPDGSINAIFRYRYVVYHCAHYGEPRMRGNGKRPNQNYLPCGCHAMLRLNYSFQDRVLKITTLVDQHTGHEATEEIYNRASQKLRTPSPGTPQSTASRPVKRERNSVSSPFSMRNSPANSSASSSGSYQNSPVTPYMNVFQQFQQPQLMQALINQQKENFNQIANQQLQYAINHQNMARQTQQNPAVLNLLMQNMISMPFMQPAHGIVAPQAPVPHEPQPQMKASTASPMPSTPVCAPAQVDHSENKKVAVEIINEFNLPANLPAPKPKRASVAEPVPVCLPSQASVSASTVAKVAEKEDVKPPAAELPVPATPVLDSRTRLQLLAQSIVASTIAMSPEQAALRADALKQLIDSWNL